MDTRVTMLPKIPMTVVLATMASCGNPVGWSEDGGAGGISGGGSGSGGSLLSGDGGASGANPDLTATGQTCGGLGTTRRCCTSGIQTCTASGEFVVWTACLDTNGTTITCGSVGGGCAPGEIGRVCDGGSGSGGSSGGGGGGSGSSSGGPPPPPPLCADPTLNSEPEILVGYSPASGQTVGLSGQIKVWVNDEHPPFIAPGEQVDPNTGAILAPGNRTATATDGLLWEPALYIAPQTPQNGGTPHFPQWIKGWYNNAAPSFGATFGFQVPGMDSPPSGSTLTAKYTGEDIWDVSSLGLPPGTYTGVFVIHDGDRDRAIGCVTIAITP